MKQTNNKWNVTRNGYKWREFKEGCIEICRKGEDKESMLIVLNHLVEEYVEITDKLYDAFDCDLHEALDTLIENKDEIKDEYFEDD